MVDNYAVAGTSLPEQSCVTGTCLVDNYAVAGTSLPEQSFVTGTCLVDNYAVAGMSLLHNRDGSFFVTHLSKTVLTY